MGMGQQASRRGDERLDEKQGQIIPRRADMKGTALEANTTDKATSSAHGIRRNREP